MTYRPVFVSRLGKAVIASALLLGTVAPVSMAAQPDLMAQSVPEEGTRSPREGRRPRPHHPHRHLDIARAAAALDTTETELREALGLPEPSAERGRERFAAAATRLGVTEAALRDALGVTLDPETGRPVRPQSRPDLETAAAQLNVTEEEIKAAFRGPEGERRGQRPQLDIAGAAEAFGVSEAEMIELLGLRGRPSGPRTGSRRS